VWRRPHGPVQKPMLITGATGTLGRAFARIAELRGIPHVLLNRSEMDISDTASVRAALQEFGPWAVVNAAGYVRVDDAELDCERCFRENTEGARILAEECERLGAEYLTFSSDLVFDGEKGAPYVESDATHPLNAYGRSKQQAEELVLEANPKALVVRTSAFFGPWDEYNFVHQTLRALAGNDSFTAANDYAVSPTYVPDLVNASLDLLIDGETGIMHLANTGATTWFDLARRAAEMTGFDPARVRSCSIQDTGVTAARPRYSVLGSERTFMMPSLEDALARYVRDNIFPWDRVEAPQAA
jgi:dTDP-4-dehydrorhamnose reductase